MNAEYVKKVIIHPHSRVVYFSYMGERIIVLFTEYGMPMVIHSGKEPLMAFSVNTSAGGTVKVMAVRGVPLFTMVKGINPSFQYSVVEDMVVYNVRPAKMINPSDAVFEGAVDVYPIADAFSGHIEVTYRYGETRCRYHPQ